MKVRSNEVTKSKCCLSVVRHMFMGSFGTQNLMVTLICKFDPKKGALQVKIGQIKSNSKSFLQKHAHLVQICLRIPKMSIICIYGNYKCQKLHFKECDVITFTCFLAIAQQKTKILLWNFVCVLFVCISITYIPFFG